MTDVPLCVLRGDMPHSAWLEGVTLAEWRARYDQIAPGMWRCKESRLQLKRRLQAQWRSGE